MTENTHQTANKDGGFQPPGTPYRPCLLQNDNYNSSVVSSPPPINSDGQAHPYTSLPPRKSKKPKTSRKTKGPNYIPQPKNSFLCFRSKFVAAHASSLANGEKQQNELSKKAGELWRAMTQDQKSEYHEEARKEREKHAIKYPTYAPKERRRQGSSRRDKNPTSPEVATEAFLRGTLPFNSQPFFQNPAEQIAGPRHSLETNGHATFTHGLPFNHGVESNMPELFQPDHPPIFPHQSFAGADPTLTMASSQQFEGYRQYDNFQHSFVPQQLSSPMGYMPEFHLPQASMAIQPLPYPPLRETFMPPSIQSDSFWTSDVLVDYDISAQISGFSPHPDE